MAERALLRNVREGDLNYQKALDRAGTLINGLRVHARDPVLHAILSASGFTTLCVRAAIEGGLSPENAYVVGDSYIQTLLGCKTVTDVRIVNHEMYDDFIRRVHKCRMNPNVSPQIQSCCDFIELHPEEPLPLRLLAERTGYTDYYLSRKFKRETGVHINDYIKFARIERAKILLTTTDLSVLKIAEQLQFCSGSYFAEVFQAVAGMSPQQWRAQNKRI